MVVIPWAHNRGRYHEVINFLWRETHDLQKPSSAKKKHLAARLGKTSSGSERKKKHLQIQLTKKKVSLRESSVKKNVLSVESLWAKNVFQGESFDDVSQAIFCSEVLPKTGVSFLPSPSVELFNFFELSYPKITLFLRAARHVKITLSSRLQFWFSCSIPTLHALLSGVTNSTAFFDGTVLWFEEDWMTESKSGYRLVVKHFTVWEHWINRLANVRRDHNSLGNPL